jgi:2-polyprenyl-3-methyl-5-hydroxy-6-metoxy-1,4-benzoquinol methylase
MAASMPSARVVGIDISEASLGFAEEHIRTLWLDNIELHCLPIAQRRSLGRDFDFDFVQCTGVIHHLADPVAGMRALGSVLRQDGALMVMMYAEYGRYGIYMLQELCRTLSPKGQRDALRTHMYQGDDNRYQSPHHRAIPLEPGLERRRIPRS